MKAKSIFSRISLFIGFLVCAASFLQSCSPVENIPPIMPSYMVSVKVINNNSSSILPDQSKHFQVVSVCETQKILLDTIITGNFTYTFKSDKPNINIKATLTSASAFISSMEIDANGKLNAYHSGSCAGTEFEISDNISF